MATDKQISANRANAAKSTGPRTTTGREKSSRNSLRHGILARTIVIEGESLRRFSALLSDLEETFQPSGPVEKDLVENMAVARWRQMRLWGLEKSGLSRELRRQESDTDNAHILKENASTRVAIAFRTLSDSSRSLDLMHRYEGRYERQYRGALNQLLQLKENMNSSKRTQFLADKEPTDAA